MSDWTALTIFAALPVRDLAAATQFYAALFGRQPDNSPSDGIAEWYLVDRGGPERGTLQLRTDPRRAGGGLATINVADMSAVASAAERVAKTLQPRVFPIDAATVVAVSIAEVEDPDGNALTIVQPHFRSDPASAQIHG